MMMMATSEHSDNDHAELAMSDCGDGSVDGDCIPDGEGVCADDGDAHGDSPRDRNRQSEA